MIPAFLVLVILLQGGGAAEDAGGPRLLEIHAGEGSKILSMEADTTLQVHGNLGDLRIELQGARARVAESPCPGQDCVAQGWISRPGEMAVCVPSGVFLLVSSSGDPCSPDAISY